VVGSLVTITVGVLAGAETTTGLGGTPPGTPGGALPAGQPQKYIISDATGAICNVLPDPP
jgi:hypothetical protein